MKQTGNQIIQQAVTSYKEGRHEDAVKLYRSAIKNSTRQCNNLL